MSLTRLIFIVTISIFLFGSCKKELPTFPDSETPYQDSLFISTTSYDLPLNSFGKATLTARDEFGGDLTSLTSFYINGILSDGQVFIPPTTGTFLHGPGVPERIASVINSQILNVGENVDFGE